MRIIIVSRIFSPEPSAASLVLEAIVIRFRDTGHEVTVLTTRPPRRMPVSTIPGITVRWAKVLRDRHGYVRGYLRYLSLALALFLRLLFRRRAGLYLVQPPPTMGAIMRVAM